MGRGQSSSRNFILGAGATGLGAAYESGWEVLEAASHPGGICSSYYIDPSEELRPGSLSHDKEGFRFEIGGGHWLFGGAAEVISFFERYSALTTYQRRASVYLPDEDLLIPYPIQNNVRFLPATIRSAVLEELEDLGKSEFQTMKEWLVHSFGYTLCNLFFFPFHELYTAGLYHHIAPQDAYKSPIQKDLILQGSKSESVPAGYNTSFRYPDIGLGKLFQNIAAECNIHYNSEVVRIDNVAKKVYCSNEEEFSYERIVSTLPLNRMCKLVGHDIGAEAPYTSVLVLNIGARRGTRYITDHWIYFPSSASGFHRVGSYSNVDKRFLPRRLRENDKFISLYVEKAYSGGVRPSSEELTMTAEKIVKELQTLGFVGELLVADPTWIDVAYTWSYPTSHWKEEAIKALDKGGIIQTGRYGLWRFQGIADSIKEGFEIGKKFAN